LEESDYVDLADKNATFLLGSLSKNGRMLRSYKDGRAVIPGYLEDQASVADGLLSLYEATFDRRWLITIRDLVNNMLEVFWDDEAGVFFDTAADQTPLLVRPQDPTDNAIPSGTSMAVDVLLRAGRLLGEDRWAAVGRRALEALAPTAAKAPLAFGRLLAALDFELGHPIELAIIGPRSDPLTVELLKVANSRYLPNHLLALAPAPDGKDVPLLDGRQAIGGQPTAYLCEGFVCRAPTTDAKELAIQIDRVMTPS
jgi:uncharacterized protein YyaL (SSP411 family)